MEHTTEHKLSVLARVARTLNEHELSWALASSVVLYFNGVAEEFHDLDIMVDEAHFDAAAEALAALGEQHQPVLLPDKYATKRFTKFTVDGVEIDLMGGFAIVRGGAVYHFPMTPDTVERTVQVQGQAVPLQWLELWRRCYELMGRAARVESIDRFLEERRGHS
ncbi:MAG: hypothetical protein IJ484_01920 [Oscillospiraceae bacterium]|nr:hypothetical protein [Oscillospiraceae bacterium]